ncbi:type 4b pilus protein PilO2 [Epibacterium sp. DP7N7-1]|nr:type 4b pilus protein PilO2 [Epibacterium sp. DP7N7-1]
MIFGKKKFDETNHGSVGEISNQSSLDGAISGGDGANARKGISTSPDLNLEDVGVLAFGKKRTAVGLSWASFEDDMTIRAKVAEMTDFNSEDPTQQTVEFKFYTDTKQTGLIGVGSPEWGQAAGMKALVTMLSPELTGPRWLGAFQINEANDTWWVASIRDGKVFGDQIVRSKHHAEQIFLNDLEAPDWISVYAPKEWGIPQTKHDQLYQLVDLRIGAKLKSITPLKDNLPKIIMGTMVSAIAISGYLYLDYKRAEELRQLEEMRRKAEAGMTYAPQDLPWFNATPLRDFVEVCMQEISQSIILVPGWEAQPISCTVQQGKGTISTGFSRSGGRLSWLRSAISPTEPLPVLSSNGETASWGRNFTAPVDLESIHAKPWEGDLIENRMRERFQVLETDLAIRPADSNRRTAAATPVFNSHEMKISGSFGMTIFGDILEDVPALVPQGLIYNPETGKWDMALKVYHPPLLPPQPY